MMNMVKSNVSGKPLQHFRQSVEGAAIQGRIDEIPIIAAHPIRVFEIVLHVEEPHSSGPADRRDYELYQEVILPTEQPPQSSDHER